MSRLIDADKLLNVFNVLNEHNINGKVSIEKGE